MLPSRTSLFGLDGAHGWNIDIVIRGTVVSLVRQLLLVGTRGFRGAGLCTLLGPEGPATDRNGSCSYLRTETPVRVFGSNGSWYHVPLGVWWRIPPVF